MVHAVHRQLTLPLQFPLSLDELVRRIVALKWTMTDEHRAELRRILAARYPEFGDAASRSPLTEPAAVLTRGNELW
jgi:hypothetical protein